MGDIKAELRDDMKRIPDNEYLAYVNGIIDDADFESTIHIEIPSFKDPEILNTVNAAIVNAANPKRLHFAICYQDDDMEMLAKLKMIPNVEIKHYASKDAPGTCRARYDCSSMIGDEDFTLGLDGHMRFAKYWDIALISVWHECDDDKAILTEYALNYSDFVDEPVDSDVFIKNTRVHMSSLIGLVSCDEFSCRFMPQAWPHHGTEKPRRGLLASGHFAFAKSGISRDVSCDPNMFFMGDELPRSLRFYTYGYNIYHPHIRFIYHLFHRTKVLKETRNLDLPRFSKNYKNDKGEDRRLVETKRINKLYGVSDEDVDLGEFGPGPVRTVESFFEFAGLDPKTKGIRKFAHDGHFDTPHDAKDLEFIDWVTHNFKNKDFSISSSTKVTGFDLNNDKNNNGPIEIMPNANGKAIKLFAHHVTKEAPNNAYAHCLFDIDDFDLESTILVQIPSFSDPELMNTIRSLFYNAACPSRIRVALYMRGDDLGTRKLLDGVPNIKIKYVSDNAGQMLPSARYELGQMVDGEDFVFRADSHMRFAKYWDVCMIDQWRRCDDEKAVLTMYPAKYDDHVLDTVTDNIFTSMACRNWHIGLDGFVGDGLSPIFTAGALIESDDYDPVRTAFMVPYCAFAKAGIEKAVPDDPHMRLDECKASIGARYWTHGYNFYIPSVAFVFYLYDYETLMLKQRHVRIRRYEMPGADKIREGQRLLDLYDICDNDVDLGEFGLGIERTLLEYQRFAGVYFATRTILNRAHTGVYDKLASNSDMGEFDWRSKHNAGTSVFVPSPDTVKRITAAAQRLGKSPKEIFDMAMAAFLSYSETMGK